MNQPSYSLVEFFGVTEGHAFADKLDEALGTERFQPLRDNIAQRLASIPWPEAASEIVTKTNDALNMSLPAILVRAWNGAGILNKYVNPKKYDPEEVFLVELMEHKIKSNHKPHIDVRVNGEKVGAIDFEVDIEVKVQGVVLKIQDARVKAIKTGALKGSGKLLCQGLILAKEKDKTFTLPGTLDLGEGIPIG